MSRRLVAAALAALGLAGALGAESPAWPGETIRWGTRADAALALPLAAAADGTWRPGYGLRLGGTFEEDLFPVGQWGLDLGILTIPASAGANLAQGWAGLNWAWPISLGGLRLSPELGLGVDLALGPGAPPADPAALPPAAVSAGFRAGIGVPIELYLGGFRFLRLVPELSVSSSRAWLPVFSVGLGIREERVVLLPEGEVKPKLFLEPRMFSPDGDGEAETIRFWLTAGKPRYVVDWRLDIYDPVGNPFRSWNGQGVPPQNILWDGRSEDGELVTAAVDYRVVLGVHDRFGRLKTAGDLALVDVLIEHDGNNLRLRIPNIAFPANSSEVKVADMEDVTLTDQNRKVLERLVQIFTRFPEYQIIIRGHANLVNWQTPDLAAIEQVQELVPLSRLRAQSVKDALVGLGIAERRVTVVGAGAAEPLVDFGDQANLWKNRRVEIFLRKP